MQIWGSENGLPQGSVGSIVQTKDGYLWFATYCGLARFDGVRFTVFDSSNTPALQSSRITSLLEDENGVLWIGQESGDLARKDPRLGFTTCHLKKRTEDREVYAIRADEKGDVWLVTGKGLLIRAKDGLELSPKQGNSTLVSVGNDRTGRLWIARDGATSSLENAILKSEPLERDASQLYVQGVCGAQDGGMWIVAERRVGKWKDGRWSEDWGRAPFNRSPVTAMIETKEGTLALGTQNNGLYIMTRSGKSLHYNLANGFPSNWVRSIYQDREGNLWVGTGGGGVAVLRPGNLAEAIPPDRWQGRPLVSAFQHSDGGIWIGTEGAGIYRFKDDEWTHFGLQTGPENIFAWSLAEDSHGALWVGTWGAGLLIQQGDTFQRSSYIPLGVPITALYCDRRGIMWVGTRQGLLRCEGAEALVIARNSEPGSTDILAIVEDHEGALWFGTAGAGLGQVKNGAVRYYRQADGLASDHIRCLYTDREGSLWIGTQGGGINRFAAGRFSHFGINEGLPSGFISSIQEDGNGNFWLGSQVGLIRVERVSLIACCEGQRPRAPCFVYSREDGLPTRECTGGLQRSPWGSNLGDPWICTSKGLARITSQTVYLNSLPPL